METMLSIIHVVLSILIVAAAIYAIIIKDLIIATTIVAAINLLIALEFALLNAPVIALVEAGVGAGLTMVVLKLVVRTTQRMEGET